MPESFTSKPVESRSKLGSTILSPELVLRNLRNLVAPRSQTLPISVGFYVTTKCNQNCEYCDVKDLKVEDLPTTQVIELLKKIRESTPSLTISGGEPLLRSDIVEILQAAKELGFHPINLFSNLTLLDRHPEVLDYVDLLSTSLARTEDYESVTHGKNSTEIIKKTIEKYAPLQGEKEFILNVNCVLGPHNLEPGNTQMARDVIDFILSNQCALAIGPQVDTEGNPDPSLTDENQIKKEYQEVIDYVIKLKKSGAPILSTLKFLEHVRDFKKFKCAPTLAPRIYPNGDMIFPCGYIKSRVRNLLETPESINDIIRAAQKETRFSCDRSCQIGCYMEPSLTFKDPLSLMREIRFAVKAKML